MADPLSVWAESVGIYPRVLAAAAGTVAVLAAGSVVRILATRRDAPSVRSSRLASLATWWVLLAIFLGAMFAGRLGGLLLMAIVSLLGVREFMRMASSRWPQGMPGRWIAYSAIPIAYYCLYRDWQMLFASLVPVFIFLGIPARMVLTGRTEEFLQVVGSLSWGAVLLVFCFPHAGRLLALPNDTNPVGGAAGWFFFLIVMTQLNDIAQALWGRRFGRHQIAKRVSPGKTWEGFLLGIGTTVVVAVVAAPWLTPLSEPQPSRFAGHGPELPMVWAALAGLLIGVGGFMGDVTMSAVKRDAGLKDSGTMLPGQGGILDRIDSLTFSAPLFFYYVFWLYPAAAPA